MLFHRKTASEPCRSLIDLFALAAVLIFFPLCGFAAVPGQLLPKPGDTTTQQTETPAPAQPATPVVEAIPLSDVAKRLETSRRQIRDVGERVQDPEVSEIAKEIEATRNTFAEEAKSADSAVAKSLTTAGGTFRPRDLLEKSGGQAGQMAAGCLAMDQPTL